MGVFRDLTGQTFGRLLVTDLVDRGGKNKSAKWCCMCECGMVTHVYTYALNNGSVRSCGCSRVEWNKTGDARRIDGRKKNPLYSSYMSAQNRARKRGLEFTLKFEDLIVPEHCPVLGMKLEHSTGGHADNSPSLDRVDNSKGYTQDNVRIISRRANCLKNDATLEELEAIVRYIKGE